MLAATLIWKWNGSCNHCYWNQSIKLYFTPDWKSDKQHTYSSEKKQTQKVDRELVLEKSLCGRGIGCWCFRYRSWERLVRRPNSHLKLSVIRSRREKLFVGQIAPSPWWIGRGFRVVNYTCSRHPAFRIQLFCSWRWREPLTHSFLEGKRREPWLSAKERSFLFCPAVSQWRLDSRCFSGYACLPPSQEFVSQTDETLTECGTSLCCPKLE